MFVSRLLFSFHLKSITVFFCLNPCVFSLRFSFNVLHFFCNFWPLLACFLDSQRFSVIFAGFLRFGKNFPFSPASLEIRSDFFIDHLQMLQRPSISSFHVFARSFHSPIAHWISTVFKNMLPFSVFLVVAVEPELMHEQCKSIIWSWERVRRRAQRSKSHTSRKSQKSNETTLQGSKKMLQKKRILKKMVIPTRNIWIARSCAEKGHC